MPKAKAGAMTDAILITGASGGIGLALATVCAEKGHNLVLVARNHERLSAIGDDLAKTYNISVHTIEQDLSAMDAAESVVANIDKHHIQVSGLINNAGFGLGGAFAESDAAKLTGMLQVNMVALTELMRLLLPKMVENKSGRILNVASIAAFLPGPYMAAYYASKAYVLSLSQGVAEEVSASGVTVTALCPGPTKTNFAAAANVQKSRIFKGHLLDVREVAVAGYAGMMAGDLVVIPGFSNKVTTTMARFVPRGLLSAVAGKANRS